MLTVSLYDQIKTVVNVQADFCIHEMSDKDNSVIPKGTVGTVVECYENPEGYAVDIAIPDERLVGGFFYTNVILNSDQFEVVSTVTATVS
jgi:hypothetical protein